MRDQQRKKLQAAANVGKDDFLEQVAVLFSTPLFKVIDLIDAIQNQDLQIPPDWVNAIADMFNATKYKDGIALPFYILAAQMGSLLAHSNLVNYYLGSNALAQKNYELAEEHAKFILARNQNLGNYLLGKIYSHMNYWNQAILFFNKIDKSGGSVYQDAQCEIKMLQASCQLLASQCGFDSDVELLEAGKSLFGLKLFASDGTSSRPASPFLQDENCCDSENTSGRSSPLPAFRATT